jgi:Tol biopolymer transport system component
VGASGHGQGTGATAHSGDPAEAGSPQGGVKPPLHGGDQASSDTKMVATLVSHHRGMFIAAGLFIAALLVVGGYSVYRMVRPASPTTVPPSTANLQFTQLTTSGTVGGAANSPGALESGPAISPDGRYVAYVQGGQSIWLRQIATGSTVQIVPTVAGAGYGCLVFSRDGNYIDYLRTAQSGNNASDLYQVPVLGGPSTKLLDLVDSAIGFSPDGKQLAFVRDLPANAGTQLVIADTDGSNVRTLATVAAPNPGISRGN